MIRTWIAVLAIACLAVGLVVIVPNKPDTKRVQTIRYQVWPIRWNVYPTTTLAPEPPPTVPEEPATVPATNARSAPIEASGGATGDGWEALRQCESGGDYTNHDGQYRGAYQFDYGTWASVGGSGDPADASPAEQDMRAQMLYNERGAAPWPVCGRHIR